tara:strand:+ start:160 stop:705 length:546 start_codon:yes stop_codon:yes gene_type:complete
MRLFDLKDRNVIISPEALLIPEFKALWTRDKSKEKLKAMRELSYIYFICDYKSPYRDSYALSRLEAMVCKDFMKDEKYTPDAKVSAAKSKYKELQKTPSMLLLDASLQTVNKLTDYLQNIDLTERDKNDKPIYKPSDVTSSLKNIGGIVESLSKVKESVEKEMSEQASLRGQRKKGNREDP